MDCLRLSLDPLFPPDGACWCAGVPLTRCALSFWLSQAPLKTSLTFGMQSWGHVRRQNACWIWMGLMSMSQYSFQLQARCMNFAACNLATAESQLLCSMQQRLENIDWIFHHVLLALWAGPVSYSCCFFFKENNKGPLNEYHRVWIFELVLIIKQKTCRKADKFCVGDAVWGHLLSIF